MEENREIYCIGNAAHTPNIAISNINYRYIMEFVAEIGKIGISRTMLEAAAGAYRELFEASEGDARRYMKAALEKAGLADGLEDYFGRDWTGQVYRLVRKFFVYQGGCDIYYIPGIARLAYGSCNDFGDPDFLDWESIKSIVRFISTAHKNEFSRNLERITTIQEGPKKGMRVKGSPMGLDELERMFSKEIEETEESAKKEFETSVRSPKGYRIIELTDYGMASEYLKYTPATSPWCYLANRETFEDYRSGGNRLYLALAPGFEKLKPGDRGYGRSMIGFDMGPVDENGISKMKICNNRYNHDPDLEEENTRTGDYKYTELELSEILGIPVWRDCPGFSEEELVRLGLVTRKTIERMFRSPSSLEYGAGTGQDMFREQYGVRVEYCPFVEMRPYEFINARTGMIVCYAVVDQDSGDITFFDMYRRLCGDVFVITDVGRGSKLVDDRGKVLCDDWYAQIGKPDTSGFPVPVARKSGRQLEWNLMGMDGRLLYDRWYTSLAGPYAGKYLVVTGDDGKSNLCTVKDMNPIAGPMDKIVHTVVDQEHVFMLADSGKYNYFAEGGLLLDEWADTPLKTSDLYCMMRERHGLPA